MLPKNFNLYIRGRYEVKQLIERDINYVLGFTHPGNKDEPDISFLGDIPITIFNYHDVWSSYHPKELVWPDEALIEEILKHAEIIDQKLKNGEQINLLCFCQAGISRSTATAYIILCYLLGEWNEQEAYNQIMQRRNIARPNPLMVYLADKMMDRKYKMISVSTNFVDFEKRTRQDK